MLFLGDFGAVLTAVLFATTNALPAPQDGSSATASASESDLLPTATLDVGVIVGTTTTVPSASASVHQFLGVPFAVSPPLRFAPPVPVEPWTGAKDTQKRAPACVQQFMGDEQAVNITKTLFAYPDSEESEDCLYLNVFVPDTPTTDKAVMNWIFPGNLYFGDASRPQYDGSSFAANHDVIVVAGNYRTNVFGFSNSTALEQTERNAGYYDQRLVLDWIQRNIAAFGGCPDKVLIFGESSGAASVDRLVNTHNPNFRAAIAQSGSASISPFPNEHADSWPKLVEQTNCTRSSPDEELACVRGVDALVLKSLIETQAIIFPPVNDGITQIPTPINTVPHVPYLTGHNGGEGYPFKIGASDLEAAIYYDLYNPSDAQVAAIKAAYPISPASDNDNGTTTPSNATDVIAQLFTDIYFNCPLTYFSSSPSSDSDSDSAPIYRYFFNQSYPNLQFLLQTPLALDLHSYHTIEASLVFGTYPRENATDEQIAMSAFLQATWARFAKDPDAGPTPGWSAYSTGDGTGDVGEFVPVSDGAAGASVKLIDSRDLDVRCELFRDQFDTVVYPAF